MLHHNYIDSPSLTFLSKFLFYFNIKLIRSPKMPPVFLHFSELKPLLTNIFVPDLHRFLPKINPPSENAVVYKLLVEGEYVDVSTAGYVMYIGRNDVFKGTVWSLIGVNGAEELVYKYLEAVKNEVPVLIEIAQFLFRTRKWQKSVIGAGIVAGIGFVGYVGYEVVKIVGIVAK
ncbi:Hypothetical_protein [Hexamita inflata]|uniref:Hypothetical_protein n=1 Tax=Hexamita inflata TaxID=28002 RepID=A0AA86TSS8_9EUKA|nr:Hypothetical protein HINF_LOCUS14956 [Hexamita inflata]